MKNPLLKAGVVFAFAALAATFLSPLGAQVTFTQQYAPGDVTHILGNLPYFPNGFVEPASLVKFAAVSDADATPATIGQVLYFKLSTQTWVKADSASAALVPGTYGVVTQGASAQNGTATIQTKGLGTAYVLQVATTPLPTVGAPMALGAAGNLIAGSSTPSAGVTVAVAATTMPTPVGTSTPGQALMPVFVGGY